MKNTMTIYGTYNHENDTKLTFTKTESRSEIELAFISGDPDYGTETLICGGDKNETFMSLCKDQLKELTSFLDETNDGTYRPCDVVANYNHLDDLNNSSLIAFENMLHDIIDGKHRKLKAGKNEHNHDVMIDKISVVADVIRRKFVNGDIRRAYIASDPNDDGSLNSELQCCWHRIDRLVLPFDNIDTEFALLMGYLGGGNVTMAYSYEESDTKAFTDDIVKMICESTGMESDETVYAEFIGINEKDESDAPKAKNEISVETKAGTLVATAHQADDYPCICFQLKRDGKELDAGFIEVDQVDDDDDVAKPALKTHIYNADVNETDPVYDLTINRDELDKFFKEVERV